MSAPDPRALGARAEAMIAELGAISAEPGRLVRLFLTPEHRRAADLVADWMRAAGLSVSEDALGTVRGRFGSAKPRLPKGDHARPGGQMKGCAWLNGGRLRTCFHGLTYPLSNAVRDRSGFAL